MIFRKTLAAGILLIVAALALSPGLMISALRNIPTDERLSTQLHFGAELFRAGLGILGLVLVTISLPKIRNATGWSSGSPEQTKLFTTPVIVLLLISFLLRLYKLGEGLWLDEIGMYLKYMERPFGELLTTYDSENQHILYTLLAKLSLFVFDDVGIAIRFPAVLFGVAGVWALYLLGTTLASRHEGFLAAVLLSLSYYHVWFSQNARGYTGLLFWTLFSSWFFVRAMRTASTRVWIYYALTVALGMYTQLVMLFVVAAHFLIFLYRIAFRRDLTSNRSGFYFGFALSVILTFQLYSLVLPQFFSTIGMKGTVAAWNSPFWTLSEIVRGLRISFAGAFVALAACAVFLLGLWGYLKKQPVLLPLTIIPPVLGATVVILLDHPLWPRFFFFAFGFGALIVIRGGLVMGEILNKFLKGTRFGLTDAGAGILISCCFIAVSALSIPRAYLPKQDFTGAFSFVQKNQRSGDAIVAVGRASVAYKDFYKADLKVAESAGQLNSIRAHSTRTWLLYMIPEDVEAVYPEIMKLIRKDFRIVKKFPSPLADGAIFVSISNGTGANAQ